MDNKQNSPFPWQYLDEKYDTQMEVEQDPCGAHMAIQAQAAKIAEQQAQIEALREASECEQLLGWMSAHHIPLQLLQEEDGLWIVANSCANTVMGSGGSAEDALREARATLSQTGKQS